MKREQSIVVHNTHHQRRFRSPLIAIARQPGYLVRIVFFDVAPDECRRRNRNRSKPVPEAVMDEFIRTFEIPASDEAGRVICFSDIHASKRGKRKELLY